MAILYHKRDFFVWFFIKSSQIFFPKMPCFFRFGHFRFFYVESGNAALCFLLYLYIVALRKNGKFEHFSQLKRHKKSRFDAKNVIGSLLLVFIFSQIRAQIPKRLPSRYLRRLRGCDRPAHSPKPFPHILRNF